MTKEELRKQLEDICDKLKSETWEAPVDEPVWIDPETGLMWQVHHHPETMTWEEAVKYCHKLIYGGFTDWRLPTIKELFSIVNMDKCNPSVNMEVFPYCRSSNYWSSTARIDYPSTARSVDFGYGLVNRSNKSSSYYVRAVRG